MASLTFTIPGQPLAANHHRVVLLLGSERLSLPITSKVVPYDGWIPAYVEDPRPGDAPVLQRVGPQLEKFSLAVVFQLPGNWQPVDGGLLMLKRFANARDGVIVGYTKHTTGLWRITSLKVTSQEMREDTNETVRADVALGFTKIAGVGSVAPVRAVAAPASVATPRPSARATPAPVAKTTRYTVKSGDTLSRIAARLLGSANRFPEIAKLNKISNPNRIRVGQVLTIPPR
jgi:nucleoid-associated protein YgaU